MALLNIYLFRNNCASPLNNHQEQSPSYSQRPFRGQQYSPSHLLPVHPIQGGHHLNPRSPIRGQQSESLQPRVSDNPINGLGLQERLGEVEAGEDVGSEASRESRTSERGTSTADPTGKKILIRLHNILVAVAIRN